MLQGRITAIAAAALLALPLATPSALADGGGKYHVTITNLTHSQVFTPLLVATHKRGVRIFTPGETASDALAALAESGDTAPLQTRLEGSDAVKDVAVADGPLLPGHSVTIVVRRSGNRDRVSVAGMLVPTNDAFVGLADAAGPRGHSVTYRVPAYDAGSETNDELCAHIPAGGGCAGEGVSETDDGEGFVHVHRGIHGIGDLEAATYDWRNPVASIRITRGH